MEKSTQSSIPMEVFLQEPDRLSEALLEKVKKGLEGVGELRKEIGTRRRIGITATLRLD